jgi:hypothetical protein
LIVGQEDGIGDIQNDSVQLRRFAQRSTLPLALGRAMTQRANFRLELALLGGLALRTDGALAVIRWVPGRFSVTRHRRLPASTGEMPKAK